MEKHCVVKVLLAIWEIFLHENKRNYNFSIFSDKFAFILFFSFLTDQKQKSGFYQVGGLAIKSISVFCLYQVTLYFKAMPNSIDVYKGIFLHVIHVSIIFPWLKSSNNVSNTNGRNNNNNTRSVGISNISRQHHSKNWHPSQKCSAAYVGGKCKTVVCKSKM